LQDYYVNHYKFTPNKSLNCCNPDNTEEILNVENFKICTLKNDNYISDFLRNGQFYEKFFMAILTNIISKDKNMMDIGANIGLWSITYSTILYRNCKIFAFEPQEKIYNCLKKNKLLNNAQNIITYNFGLSDTNTTHYMNVSYDQQTNFGSIKINVPDTNISDTNTIKIECRIGDELNLQNIGFIKIDIEGHELQAIKGLKNTILTYKPIIIFIEIHSNNTSALDTFSLLHQFGYTKVLRFTDNNYLFIY
jgi:FkbM family methyltransferase